MLIHRASYRRGHGECYQVGRLAGSNFAANWGSVGFFGPLTVAPEYWDRAIGQRLLDATMELFEAWGTRHAGLFGVAMHRPNEPGYSTSDSFVIDDWR